MNAIGSEISQITLKEHTEICKNHFIHGTSCFEYWFFALINKVTQTTWIQVV